MKNLIIIVLVFTVLLFITIGGPWLLIGHLISGTVAFLAITEFPDNWNWKWSLAKTGVMTVCLFFGFGALFAVIVTDLARSKYKGFPF